MKSSKTNLSVLTQLLVTASEGSNMFGGTDEKYLKAIEHRGDVKSMLIHCLDSFEQDLLHSYAQASEEVFKLQLMNSIKQSFQAGLITADKLLKSDRNAYIPTNALLKILKAIRSDKYFSSDKTTMEALDQLEEWVTGGSNNLN